MNNLILPPKVQSPRVRRRKWKQVKKGIARLGDIRWEVNLRYGSHEDLAGSTPKHAG